MLATICLAPFLFFQSLHEKGKEERATVDARTLTVAVKAWYTKEGRWPVQLFDVAPLLEKGKEALLDPWGKPYQYVLGLDEKGNTIPHVWAEREVRGKLKVYGNKPQAKDDKAQEKVATERARIIVLAVKTHYVQNGEWPKKLDDIAPLLEEGKKALSDPWGKEYQYKIVSEKTADGTEIERPYVWTERVVGKETKVYGEKPPEAKKK